jgi:hypothetical protein
MCTHPLAEKEGRIPNNDSLVLIESPKEIL